MTSAQVVTMSVTDTNNSPFQDYPHLKNHTLRPSRLVFSVIHSVSCQVLLKAFTINLPCTFLFHQVRVSGELPGFLKAFDPWHTTVPS